MPVSSQVDVVLFDEFFNSPIHRELSSHVYPVEIVYGVVEVKGRLERRDLAKVCEDIAKIRALGRHRYYLYYGPVPKSDAEPHLLVAGKHEVCSNVPPRAFLFAYEQRGWTSVEALADDLRVAQQESPAHIHGLAVLESDWYLSQEPYAEGGPRFHTSYGDALLKFISGMIHSIGSVLMMPVSIDRYYRRDA